jgi:hypothetical protein
MKESLTVVTVCSRTSTVRIQNRRRRLSSSITTLAVHIPASMTILILSPPKEYIVTRRRIDGLHLMKMAAPLYISIRSIAPIRITSFNST